MLIKVKASYKLTKHGKKALELINKDKKALKEKNKEIKKEKQIKAKEFALMDKKYAEKVKKDKAKGKKTYIIMAIEAIKALKERYGSSNFAIKKYIIANNPTLKFKKHYLKKALI